MNDYPRQNPAYRLTHPHFNTIDGSIMTIEEALNLGKEALKQLPSPQFEAELLLSFALKCNRSTLIAFPERAIPSEIISQYYDLLERRSLGEPFSYITGEREFYGLSLAVSTETLIPRDDTEIIVDTALNLIPAPLDAPFSLLDLGTGTGAIALALKSMRPDIHVTALDYYEETLKVAANNAKRNQLDVTFIQSNWFSNAPLRHFDMIVSNPPYIDPVDHHLEGDGVKFEPKRALIADNKGLSDLFHLIENAPNYFKSSGWLLLEHGYDQRESLQEKMNTCGYINIKTVQDYGGNDRVTMGFFSNFQS